MQFCLFFFISKFFFLFCWDAGAAPRAATSLGETRRVLNRPVSYLSCNDARRESPTMSLLVVESKIRAPPAMSCCLVFVRVCTCVCLFVCVIMMCLFVCSFFVRVDWFIHPTSVVKSVTTWRPTAKVKR